MSAGSLSEGHGRALLGVGERGKQLRLARRASERGLSVRQVEDEVRRLNDVSTTKAAVPATALEPELADQVRDRFFSSLGVVPRLRLQGKGGRVEIPFSDADDLRRLMERLGS